MRRMRIALFALLALGSACGSPSTPRPDAGPDTSCGLDCDAQRAYGLLVNRCFEYSSDPLSAEAVPALGVWVREVFTLEGGVKAIPVEYRQNGQIRQTDYFGIAPNGDLLLYRRIAGTSVTYRTGTDITGVKWLSLGTVAGDTVSTSTTAFLSANDASEATTYRVTTAAPTTSEKKTPAGTFDSAVKVLFGEMPDHGSDPRRIFVEGTGFTILASPFSLSGGSPTPVHLQRVRDLGTPDAGPEDCSLGTP